MNFLISSLFAASGLAFGAPTTSEIIPEPVVIVETADVSESSEDALRCRIYNGQGELAAECWLCNCAKLAERL